MVKAAGIGLISVVVFALGVYGGHVAASVASLAPTSSVAPVLSEACLEEQQQSADRVEELTTLRRRMQQALVERSTGAAPPVYPDGGPPALEVRELVGSAFSGSVLLMRCDEYPCITVLSEAPDQARLAPLREGGLAPSVYQGHGRWALLSTFPSAPASDRAMRRAEVLLRVTSD